MKNVYSKHVYNHRIPLHHVSGTKGNLNSSECGKFQKTSSNYFPPEKKNRGSG